MAYSRGRYQDKWRIERQAAVVRRSLGLDQLTPLDPWLLCEAVPAHVFYPEDFPADGLARQLQAVPWDGFSFCFPDEVTLIVMLNSARPRTRQMATLMEELAHHLLGHKPCAITRDPTGGFLRRSYDPSQETEAFDLGAALILPKEKVQRDVGAHRSAAEIAREHGCSGDLVIYRIKRMRLWRRYESYAG